MIENKVNNDSRILAECIADAADDKKAQRITLIDVTQVSLMADYFVICSGQTPVQVRAIAEWIEEKIEEQGLRALAIEGRADGRWILLDLGTVIVHVMLDKEREFYGLERLWCHGTVEEWLPKSA